MFEGVITRPNALAQVDFEPSKDAGKQADQNRGQQDIAFRVLNVFGQCGHAIKADIGEGSQRTAFRMTWESKFWGRKRGATKKARPNLGREKEADRQEHDKKPR